MITSERRARSATSGTGGSERVRFFSGVNGHAISDINDDGAGRLYIPKQAKSASNLAKGRFGEDFFLQPISNSP